MSANFTIIPIDKFSEESENISLLVNLIKELESELAFPHTVLPVKILKIRMFNPQRSDQDVKYSLMIDEYKNPIGFTKFNIRLTGENRHVCYTFYYIKPKFRRSGYGKILFLESLKILPSYVTKIKVLVRVDTNQLFFKEALSIEEKIKELSSKLEIKHVYTGRRSEVDITKFRAQTVSERAKYFYDKALSNGYEIYFTDSIEFPKAPFTRIQFIQLLENITNDMPSDESSNQDFSLKEQDFMDQYKNALAEKMTYWIFIAMEKKTNLPVAMTETRFWTDTPEFAHVTDTGVLYKHRGKKLGLTLKYMMLEKLLNDSYTERKVKTWTTFNAKSNTPMISINDEFKFFQTSLEKQYEIPINKIIEYISK